MKNPLEDKILFLKVKRQDKEAYGQFYDLYVGRIYRFIFFKVSSAPDAQDLTSEVFLKLWQRLKEGQEIRNLNAFIYALARNTVIDYYRSKARTEKDLDEVGQIANEDKDMLAKQIVDSQLQGVLKGLDRLKSEYREVVILRFLDELSIKEISEILVKSKGAVRVLIHRALKALKNNIQDD